MKSALHIRHNCRNCDLVRQLRSQAKALYQVTRLVDFLQKNCLFLASKQSVLPTFTCLTSGALILPGRWLPIIGLRRQSSSPPTYLVSFIQQYPALLRSSYNDNRSNFDNNPSRSQAESGKMNVDEYSPIFTPEKWSPTGDTYAPGLAGIALWAITFTTVIGGAAYLVVNTSALGAC